MQSSPAPDLGLQLTEERSSGAAASDSRYLSVGLTAASAVMQGLVRSGLSSLRRVRFATVLSQSTALLSFPSVQPHMTVAGCRSRRFAAAL